MLVVLCMDRSRLFGNHCRKDGDCMIHPEFPNGKNNRVIFIVGLLEQCVKRKTAFFRHNRLLVVLQKMDNYGLLAVLVSTIKSSCTPVVFDEEVGSSLEQFFDDVKFPMTAGMSKRGVSIVVNCIDFCTSIQ